MGVYLLLCVYTSRMAIDDETRLVERDVLRALVREQLPGVRRQLEPLGLLARNLFLVFLLL